MSSELTNETVSPKSRLCAMLLGIFLGNIGVHNFYLGKIGKGLTQVLMTVFGFVLYFVGFAKAAVNLITLGEDVSSLSPLNALSSFGPSAGLLLFGILLLIVPSIWAFVEWIIIATGNGTDKNSLRVKNWVND